MVSFALFHRRSWSEALLSYLKWLQSIKIKIAMEKKTKRWIEISHTELLLSRYHVSKHSFSTPSWLWYDMTPVAAFLRLSRRRPIMSKILFLFSSPLQPNRKEILRCYVAIYERNEISSRWISSLKISSRFSFWFLFKSPRGRLRTGCCCLALHLVEVCLFTLTLMDFLRGAHLTWTALTATCCRHWNWNAKRN